MGGFFSVRLVTKPLPKVKVSGLGVVSSFEFLDNVPQNHLVSASGPTSIVDVDV